MVSFCNRLNLLISILILGGCVYGHIKPEDVKEYRYFPEYKGYLPIKDNTVQADWVIPVQTSDGKLDYSLPLTSYQAEQRVRQTAERYKELHPVISFPLGVTLFVAPAFYLGFSPLLILSEYYAHFYPEKFRQRQLKQLEEFAGIKVKIQVVDERGIVIPNARIIEMATPSESPVFVDKDGIRSFAPPAMYSYTLYDTKMLKLIAEHLPICIGSVEGFFFGGCKNRTFDQKADLTGKVEYINLSAGRFARYSWKEEKWYWDRPQTPLTLSFIVWAFGFKPSIYSVSEVKAGDEVNLTAVLERLPDGVRIENISREFQGILDRVPKAINIKAFKTKIDAQAVKEITEKLKDWVMDESLPDYIRWNAYVLLKQISLYLSYDKKIEQEVKATIEKVKEEAEPLTPYLNDSPYNPWRLKERYESLFFVPVAMMEAGKIYGLYGYKELKIDQKLVDEVQDLLSKASAINPAIPELDNLRAIIALSEGDRARALSYSKYLPHHPFFKLFYGLSLSEPRYK
ncbi:MAG: hypothetical protein N2257_05260 [Thermodesulfovibrionales bacterium]|nr:hypothetical protein [Thermodesulfovibrionales bacterium]